MKEHENPQSEARSNETKEKTKGSSHQPRRISKRKEPISRKPGPEGMKDKKETRYINSTRRRSCSLPMKLRLIYPSRDKNEVGGWMDGWKGEMTESEMGRRGRKR